jgi:hypothetical protein
MSRANHPSDRPDPVTFANAVAAAVERILAAREGNPRAPFCNLSRSCTTRCIRLLIRLWSKGIFKRFKAISKKHSALKNPTSEY